jgi:protein involved in polysaccharide export with SLBB domain
MSKISFALVSSLFVVVSSYGYVNAASKSISCASVLNYMTQDYGVDPSPGDAKKYYKQGVKYAGMKLYTEAVAAFELAILLKPNYEDAFLSLGRTYVAMGRLPEAIKAYRRVTKLNPNHDEAYARLREINAKLAKQEQRGFRARRVSVQNETPNAERVSLERPVNSSDLRAANKIVNTAQRQSAYVPLNQRASLPSQSVGELKSNAGGARPVGSLTSSNIRSGRVLPSSPTLSASSLSNSKLKPPSNSGSTPASSRNGSQPTTARNIRANPVLPRWNRGLVSREIPLDAGPIPKAFAHRVRVNLGNPPTIPRTISANPVLPSSSRGLVSRQIPLDGPIPKAFANRVRVNLGTPPMIPRTIRTNRTLPTSILAANALSSAQLNPAIAPTNGNPFTTDVRVNVDSPPPASSLAKRDVADTTAVNKQADASAPTTSSQTNVAPNATVATSTNASGDAKVFSKAAPPKTAESSEVSIYRLGVGDVLDVRLSDLSGENQTSFTVSAGGFLDHPVLSQPIKVLGLTTDEVGVRLKEEMKKLAIERPTVTVAVSDYNSHTILVGGLVREHGTKILRREAIPLYVVLADAQPLPEAGRVTVISRQGTNTAKVDLASPDATKLLIHAGDVVMVQANPKLFFYIGGDVKNPGEKPFREELKLTQAVLIAGGLNRQSDVAELAREGTNGLLELTLYKLSEINSGKIPDPIIQPGDRITILR